ncbi:Replication protein A DNA-binding subunit B [Zea mays]|uniref:Replication protein A DNA-binding subunit B n=1 Tax=Zea mays TaxID=4577 RepID=A0A3L6E360_MAIZE|nr:Replication protein A DNA-binding subunit B [Zea mays]
MEYTLLPDLAPHKIHAKIQVHVSRKWLFRGATDSGPLQHVDMVLSDREGNAIYAEIPGNLAEQKATNIEEGEVYDISRFRVCATKTIFKIVDGDKMIQFTFHTIVKRATSPPTTFPLYVYRLTSFDLIEPHVQTTNNFVDVLGVITEIHELTPVHVRSQLIPTVTRTIIIEDLSNKTMKITLWADQAIMFNLHDVYDANTNKPILVLFVGCLPKFFKGVYLSGGPACRWYFNPTIPEAEPYLTSQSTKKIVLQLPQIYNILQRWKRSQLSNINPSMNFLQLTHMISRYKLKFLASDETDIAEMFCFDTVARHIVGKSCEIVLRSVTEQSPIPPDLAQIISLKFTFRVTIDNQSLFQQTSRPNVFRINSIVAAHGRQRSLPMQIGNSDQQGPSTPQNKSKPMLLEDSPSTALEKLSTTTPTVVRKLLYSETDNTPKAYSISFTQLSFIRFKIYANKSNINSPEKDDGDKETAQNFDICSLIQYPLTKEKDQQIQLNRHLKGSNKGRYASDKKWTSNPPRTKVSLRSSSTF